MPVETHLERDFPSPGVANGYVVAVAVGLMVMMLGAVAMLLGFYVWRLPERALPAPRQLPAPQVRTDERLLRQQIEKRQLALLAGYRWEDAGKTVIGIPIARAMQILAARGARAYDPLIAAGTTAQAPGPAAAAAHQSPTTRVPSRESLSAEPIQKQP
jgi:hypothetical protein